MARQVSADKKGKLDKDARRTLLDCRRLIEDVARADGNEAETRLRVLHIFSSVLGYDPFKHISQEYAIHGTGDAVHCDFAIKLSREDSAKPELLVELKRVNIDLAPKHLKQAASYAYEHGCDWVLLTNGREWRLYRIIFGKPPQTKLIESWHLVTDELPELMKKFELLSYKNVKKGGLTTLWEKSNVLAPANVLKALLCEESLRLVQRKLKQSTKVVVSPEDIVSAFRRLLNETAFGEMDALKISLPRNAHLKTQAGKTNTGQVKQPKVKVEDIAGSEPVSLPGARFSEN